MGDGTVIKIDNSNNIIWDRIYTLNIETYGAQFYSICSANNSDQLVGGAMVSNNCYVVAPYICRMSSNGSTIWEERWDSLYPGQSINKIELFHDSTYLVHLDSVTVQINDSGQILSTAFPTGAFILIDTGGFVSFNNHQISRLSDNLSIIWQSPYYSDRVINDLTVDSRGNYFVTGKTDTAGHGMFISKIDPSGNILFTKLYGGDLFDEGSNIIVADSDHVIAAGSYQAHIKTITSHHYYDCLLYTTYSHPIILAKLKTDPLSPLQCLSSTGNYFICNNDSIILTAPAGFIYLWNTGSTSQNIIVDTSGSFEVTITDTSGNSEILPVFNSYKYPFPSLPHFADSVFTQCSGYFNLCLGVPYSDTIADRSYRWIRSGWPTDNTPITFDISGLQAGSYYCISSNVCGSDTSGNFVLLNTPPIAHLGNDTILCTSDSILLNAGWGDYNYLWQDSINSQTLIVSSNIPDTLFYHVKKTDIQGCFTTDTIQIIFEVCTGIGYTEEVKSIYIFPNPVINELNVQSNKIKFDRVKIVDPFGKQVYLEENTNMNTRLDVSFLSNGMYFLIFETKEGMAVKKFVKE